MVLVVCWLCVGKCCGDWMVVVVVVVVVVVMIVIACEDGGERN